MVGESGRAAGNGSVESALFDLVDSPILLLEPETGAIVRANRTALEFFGCSQQEAERLTMTTIVDGFDPAADLSSWLALARDQGRHVFECSGKRKDGTAVSLQGTLYRIEQQGTTQIAAVMRDITEQRRVIEQLEYRSDFENLVAELSTHFVSLAHEDVDTEIATSLTKLADFAGADGGYVMFFSDDRATLSATHISRFEGSAARLEATQNLPVAAMPWWMGKLLSGQVVAIESVSALGPEASIEKAIIEAQGVRSLIDVPLRFAGKVVAVLGFWSGTDHRPWQSDEIKLLRMVGQVFVSALERRRADVALKATDARLRQAQKMEAVGRLAGGIAHDFNNMLTGILGFAELLAISLENDPRAEDVDEIIRTSERAASLIRQLLAFSRKQVHQPRVLQINDTISESQRMLSRVIGGHIELVVHLSPALGLVSVDPIQLDQVLMNLAANASDAMPDGGLLTIETASLTWDKPDRDDPVELPSGDYSVLTVSDTGNGMSPETRERVFEPFFSTKEEAGTGLGLATVHGIVTQWGGQITVYSELGVGTSIRIYLPRVNDEPEPLVTRETIGVVPRGDETILLVEDEDIVRAFARRLLTDKGYVVLEADSGERALELASTSAFDLVLTDVVMPGINGRELCEQLRRTQPKLRCLFMSGYAEDVIVYQGALEPGRHLVHKPFSAVELSRAVRRTLDEDAGAQEPT